MLKIIITGSTGMVGEGVLHVCLEDSRVESVLVINRHPCGVKHAKLKEIIHKDFMDWSSIEGELKGYNTCFFCMGVSSIGMKELEYTRLTYDLTIGFADLLLKLNPELCFTYVSGAGTDGTEKGKSMWARVKGKTENDLLKMPFRAAYMFRPGYIQPMKGMKNTYTSYKVLGFLYPVFRGLFPSYVIHLREIGQAMLNACTKGYSKKVLECKDIVELAKL